MLLTLVGYGSWSVVTTIPVNDARNDAVGCRGIQEETWSGRSCLLKPLGAAKEITLAACAVRRLSLAIYLSRRNAYSAS